MYCSRECLGRVSKMLFSVVIVPLVLSTFANGQQGNVLELVAISNDTSLTAGDTAFLSCVGHGQPYVEITWIRNGNPLSNDSRVAIYESEITQGGRLFLQSFLDLCSLEVTDAGAYICSVSNNASSINATTQLYVSGNEVQLVVISNDVSLTAGETALLSCVGYGLPNVEITWSRNGEVVMNSSRVNVSEKEVTRGGRLFLQSFLDLCSVEVSDAGNYTCTVSNGELATNASTQLSVTDIGNEVQLIVISNDASLTAGDTALLTCVGYGQPDVQITWSKNGEVIMNSSLITTHETNVTRGGRLYKQSYLDLCSVEVSDAGTYTCTVSNGEIATNASTQLSVTDIGNEVQLIVISNDISLTAGDTALLTCVGYGRPDVQITWSRNGEVVMNSSLITINETDVTRGGRLYKQSYLDLCSVEVSDAGTYTCTVSNGELLATNASTQLSVTDMRNEVQLIVISNDVSLTAGDTALLTCVGYGQPDVQITWSRNGEVVMNSSLITINETDVTRGGRLYKQSYLEICSLEVSDAGNYTCTVSNGESETNSSTQLSVSDIGNQVQLVVISNDVSLTAGDTALLTCVGYGQPDVQITWSRNGEGVMNNSLVTINEIDVTRGGRLYKQSFLDICSLEVSDSGNYTCTVSNGESATNATTQLLVSGDLVELIVISNNISLTVGDTALLTCVGYGQYDVDITWSRNGEVITNTSLATVYEQQMTRGGRLYENSFLDLCSLEISDTGSYTCSVSSGQLSTNATIQLSVFGDVVEVVTISNDSSLTVGDTVLLTCVGYGQPNVGITWSRNGEVIMNSSLATIHETDVTRGGRLYKQSFLDICSLEVSDSGIYTCLVSNGLLTANATIELSVFENILELIMISNDTSLTVGETALLICVGYGQPYLEITWSTNGEIIMNSSLVTIHEVDTTQGGRSYRQSSLDICSLEVSDTGSYTCAISNGLSTINASTSLSVSRNTIEVVITPSKPLSVLIGDFISLTCSPNSSSIKNFSFMWIHLNSSSTLPETNNILTLTRISPDQLGTYQCTATSNSSMGNAEVTLESARSVIQGGVYSAKLSRNCPSEEFKEDILVDVLQFLATNYGVRPLGLSRSYPAMSCAQVALAKPDAKSGLYWIRRGESATRIHCEF